ncbi:MAG: dihydroorotase [Actinobacteria bacterium]|nr:dihydroorotase [Actinomycetota bacterium]
MGWPCAWRCCSCSWHRRVLSVSSGSGTIVRGGRVIDETGTRRADVAIGDDGQIVAVGPDLDGTGATTLDASGCVVTPGFVDLHTHLREPGREEAETVESGSRAAALGGYAAVVAMPNTEPPIDCAAVVRQVLDAGAAAGLCDVRSSGAVTAGRKGEALAPYGEMAALGVRIFTDDGNGVQDEGLMRRAMEYGRTMNAVMAQHCEIDSLASGGHMNEGAWSSKLGIPGIPAEAEELMVARDIALAKLTGATVHLQHLSTAGSVDLVRTAKAAGVRCTAEATTHHFTLTDECCASYSPLFKVNPPLRIDSDVAAIKAGLADGTIDAIATDHAPHTQEVKELPFDEAPPGMLGLETALALALTELGDLSLEQIVGLLTWRPAAIAGLSDMHGGPVAEGRAANLCVFDPETAWTVDPARSASRSRNNPYAGRKLKGKVRHTILFGTPTVIDGEAQR